MATDFEIRVHRDRIELHDCKRGTRLTRTGAFSSPRLLLGDQDGAETLISVMLKEMVGSWRLLLWPTACFYPMENCEGGLSMVELKSFRDLGEALGFRRIHIVEPGRPAYKLR